MSTIEYYACDLSPKKRVLLITCYSEKKKEQSYEFILVMPHQNYCDYIRKKYKDKEVDLESKALKKAHSIISKESPSLKSDFSLSTIERKSFFKYIHKNHCSPFWKMWSVIHSKTLKKEIAEHCLNSSVLKKKP